MNDIRKVENWIKEERSSGKSWDEIRSEGSVTFLSDLTRILHCPLLSTDDWDEIVEKKKQEEERLELLIDRNGATVIGGPNEDNTITVPTDEDSAWQCYRRKLLKRDGFSADSIELMENVTIKTLRHLSRDTTGHDAVKGLVVGNVQSGKTANMTALIAMAADAGWNMFIILSGMIDNLRKQTLERLVKDLNDDSEWYWHLVDNPKKVEEYGKRLENLKLEDGDKTRYISVCIKNSKRLENLIEWLSYNDSSRGNVKLLIIDDEADQASINASTEERARINELILNLVSNRKSSGTLTCTPFRSVNYVGYTATPYANVLNEAPGEYSLYPKDFITTLPVVDTYFGPQQIFGYEDEKISYPGLDIIRPISPTDIQQIENIQDNSSEDLPDSLVRAICWFFCGVGYMRNIDYKKPVSMLVHTSRCQSAHDEIANSISNWIDSTGKENIIDICRKLWNEESTRFTLQDFINSYPDYSGNATEAHLTDYPLFTQIEHHINNLLGKGINRIKIDSKNKNRSYTSGIHLCIDNSAPNDKKDTEKRLIYPEENRMPCSAPAFLVIGGNTLSRGLTIEGLVSTFFLRPAKCSDTLMQMGRWFGYRKGYELIPRIWMPDRTRRQFEFIAEMDQRLRDEIRLMSEIGVNPAECGPRIMNSPSSRFLQIVANNKMQGAMAAEYDFAGYTMETNVFSNDQGLLEKNLDTTSEFIESLGQPVQDTQFNPYTTNNMVWRNVKLHEVKKYLEDYKYSDGLRKFNFDTLTEWLEKVTEDGLLSNWSVILAGTNRERASVWNATDNVAVGKISRTLRTPDRGDGKLNIATLRSFTDFLSDIKVSSEHAQVLDAMREVGHNTKDMNQLREAYGMGKTPQLLLYVIDKDSTPRANSNRYPLNAKCDIAGFSIYIPGFRDRHGTVRSLTIRIPNTISAGDE